VLLLWLTGILFAGETGLGIADRPLRVLILPVDGGTADGTLADYQPSFQAVERSSDLRFDVKVGQSYAAVVEAIATGVIDIAQFGAAAYIVAAERAEIEPLAVQVLEGSGVYYAGLLVRHDSPMRLVKDVAGKSVAFGDLNSTSAFVYPAAMLLAAGVDPRRDLGRVLLTGAHSTALQAVADGRVEVAAAALISYERALNQGIVKPGQLRLLARSDPIPNPFLAMRAGLPTETKAALRAAFARVHEDTARRGQTLRGYGGRTLDRWDTDFADALRGETAATLVAINQDFKEAVAAKAAQP